MAYFERTGATTFRATRHTAGAWRQDEQHVAPSLGLLAHLVEADRDSRRDDALVPARFSYDILGTMPVGPVKTSVQVLRPGRTIELVEARMSAEGRDAVVLRCWLMATGDTTAVAGTPLPRIARPDEHDPWDATTVWGGGFIASTRVRRRLTEPGMGSYWVRTDVPLLASEPVSALASAMGLVDISNGMVTRVSPVDVAFPNVDLTAHFFRAPSRGWIGFDTRVSFGANGTGITSSLVYDELGPCGEMAQLLTVRPLPQ